MTSMTMYRSVPTIRTRAFTPASRPAPRRIAFVVRAKNTGPGAGNSDPQKVKQEKDKRHSEGQWAEPSNKNPLEKQTLTRQGITGQSKGLKDESAINAEEVKQGTQDAADGAKNKLQEAGDAIAGAVDKINPAKN